MDNWLKSPWFIRIISLLLAIALYLSVSLSNEDGNMADTIFPGTSDDAVVMSDVPLQVKIDEEKYVVLGVPQSVNVKIEGSKSLVTTTEKNRSFDVFIDLTDLEAGTHEVNVQHEGLSNSLSVAIDPISVAVTIEERGSKELAVEVELLNRASLDESLLLGVPKISPETVQVTGSKSEVDKIAMVKAIVDLAGITDEIDIRNAPVKVYDQQGNELNVFVTPSTVDVAIPLEAGRKTIPISYTTIGELPEGISLQSISLAAGEVAVYGQAPVLASINTIDDITVNLSNITKDETLEIPIPVPPGATKVDPVTIGVTVDVEETQERSFEEIPIEVINLPEGKEITFIEPEDQFVTISAFGTAKQLEALSPEDFTATIDVNGFIEGEFETVITIEGPENYIITANQTNARVRIE